MQGIIVYIFCFSMLYLLIRWDANGNDITKLSTINWVIPAISFVVILILFPIVNKERKEYNRKILEQNNEIDKNIHEVKDILEIKKAELR